MNSKNMLSSRQLIILIILFIFGGTVVVGVNINYDVGQDSWISLIMSFAFIIPLMLIFARIIKIFPQKNIYEIFDILFGKIIGKILTVIFIFSLLYLGAIILHNFAEYIEITTLTETPKFPIMISLMLIIIYLGKSGIKTLGRWGPIALTIFIIFVITTMLLTIPILDIKNLKPIFDHTWSEMTKSSFKIFILPFSELVAIMGLADCFNLKNSEKKTYLCGVLITGLILLFILFRNIMVLGVPLLKNTYFSSYEVARIVEIGDFLARIEGLVTINFLFAGITKITMFVISLSKGLAHLSKNSDYKNLILPSGLLILGICPYLFDNIMDVFEFSDTFATLAIPLQVVMPIIVWIFAEFKKRKITSTYYSSLK